MLEEKCIFNVLNNDKIFETPNGSPTKLRQQLSGTVAVPSDMRSRKSFLVKAHEYNAHDADANMSAAIMIACMSAYKGWEGHLFNYLAVLDKDDNLDLLTIDHNEGYDDIDPDDVCELYAHVLVVSMTRHFLDDDHAVGLFHTILDEKRIHSKLLTALGNKISCPLVWMKAIRDQMQILPKLKASITRFLMASSDRKCKHLLYDLKGAEMITFKACIFFTYHAPKTLAHIQKYIIREMLLLRNQVKKIKTLPKEERELVALLYPDQYLPAISMYSNLAFCSVYQYKKGERWHAAIDCPHKDELKNYVREKLKGPLDLTSLTPVERQMLEEIGLNENFQEESGPLLVEYNSPKLDGLLKTLVAEIRHPPRDPVETIESITF